jgi:peptide/nickel transport system substrate-binding protein
MKVLKPMHTLRQRLASQEEVTRALGTFGPLERLAFFAGLLLSAIAVLIILAKINNHFMVAVPADGGTLHEGVVGTPRYVNPLLAVSDADRDLSVLVYRGLMKESAEGTIVPDLADSYAISADSLTYTFTLKEAYFHDGVRITSADVVFTVNAALDATVKSPQRIQWQGVTAKAVDEKTVTFTLKAPYAPFLASTMLGILPKHVWEKVPYENWTYSDFNTKNAVGSGWYKVKKVSVSSSGVPEYYELAAYRKDGVGAPRIDAITMHFYANEDALIAAYENGDIDVLGGIDPVSAKKLAEEGAQILTAPLPRVFGIFFNQNQAKIFTDPVVRKAIGLAINKNQIVKDVLGGYGATANGPIPASSGLAPQPVMASGNTAAAKTVLEKAGWKLGDDGVYTKTVKKETTRLSFEIDTNDVPELTAALDLIVTDLAQAGIEVTPKVYETGSLNQDIIRPRKFQALFFGQVVTNQSDLFAFWHSSQRTDPGLNIAGYANPSADTLLEKGLETLNPEKESAVYTSLTSTITSDMPAVFVYSPAYIYAVRENITGISLGHINKPEDRFATETSWYLDTDNVWKIFASNK